MQNRLAKMARGAHPERHTATGKTAALRGKTRKPRLWRSPAKSRELGICFAESLPIGMSARRSIQSSLNDASASSRNATSSAASNGDIDRASLHGNAPDHSKVAVLLIDVINDMEFPGGDKLAARARPIIPKLAALRARARRAKVPVIYANDNFGRWRSDFSAQVEHCLQDGVRGSQLARVLRPAPDDYFVLKPKHSAFYQTCLELLLAHLGVSTLVVGGISTDSCVTFTASDAYLRGYSLRVLRDGCAAMTASLHRDALAHMQRALHAELATSARVSLKPVRIAQRTSA